MTVYTIDDQRMSEEQIDGYMERLGLSRPEKADLSYLCTLQNRHMQRIPYDNLDCLEHHVTSLNHEELYNKIIMHKRGGICFEINGLYAWLLESLGYEVKNHAARFIADDDVYQMRRHRVMTVMIEGKRYLTDVGVNSEAPRIPLLLEENLVQSDGISEYRIERDPFWGWLLWQKLPGHTWKRRFGFTEEPQMDIDYIMPCFFCDTHPLSPFNKAEKLSILTEDANIRLWKYHYQVFRNGMRETDRIVDETENREILKDVFGIVH